MRDCTLHIYKCSGFDLGLVDLFDIEIIFCGDNSFSKPYMASVIIVMILATSFQLILLDFSLNLKRCCNGQQTLKCYSVH